MIYDATYFIIKIIISMFAKVPEKKTIYDMSKQEQIRKLVLKTI